MTTAIKKKFYVKNFASEINILTGYLDIFKKSGYRADDAFLEVGNLLVKIKHERNLDDDVFTRLKAHIAKLMGRNGLRNVNRIVAIAQCDMIQRYRDILPNDWHLLYLLSKEENLSTWISTGAIKRDMPADTVMKLLKQHQIPPSAKWVNASLKNEDVYTGEDVKKLRLLLSTSCWTIRNRYAKPNVNRSTAKKYAVNVK